MTFEQDEIIIDDWQPDELAEAIEENPLVVWCWTCMQLLYTALKKDQITLRVSSNTQKNHFDSFTDEHEVVEYGTEEIM